MAAFATRTPPTQPAMVFVDGSNLLIELGSLLSTKVRAEQPTALQISLCAQSLQRVVADRIQSGGPAGSHKVIRSYWFGSLQGSEEYLLERQTWLRDAGYEGVLFHKRKGKAEMGVDLAVAREMLLHAFNGTYDTALLVAGDEDYLGLVQDIKRLGRQVVGAFYGGKALSPRLRLAFDSFVEIPHPRSVNADLTALVCGEGVA